MKKAIFILLLSLCQLYAFSHSMLYDCNNKVTTEYSVLFYKENIQQEDIDGQEKQDVREEKTIPPSEENVLKNNTLPDISKEDKVENIKVNNETKKKTTEASKIIQNFATYIDTISYYSDSYFHNLETDINSYVDAMKYMDEEHKSEYISEKQLKGYLSDAKSNLSEHKEDADILIDNFINKFYSKANIDDKQLCLDEMKEIILCKLKEREDAIDKLETAINEEKSFSAFIEDIFYNKSALLNIGIAILIIVFLIIFIYKKTHKKKANYYPARNVDTPHHNGNADIIVRRKTTSILKKQSLEDVQNNSAYLKIDCAEFCDDSAVRRIYVKNTCIKDIYNMYADDLRNSDNPNEDGCMVLGRWVHDTETDEYYVSLEEIVKPGDDAIFQEYELNFGGKIKLKVADRLRKLRRDTNLQYDMTCWVHSHPGLGVFFSNADDNVHMQLKHPTHPKFLTAIVVDILTPDQELGIFTFKHNMSINSKSDLRKMYSLEEMYKWALASDRNSFRQEDYYNLMIKAQKKLGTCNSIQLSNSAIIDICQMETEQSSGLIGWVHGYIYGKENNNDLIIKTVSKEESISDNDILGCYIAGEYRSLPTIRKAIATISKTDNLKFVLFYSTTDELLSAIPMVDGQLSADEKYYGEEKIEDLKIWTRRRR